MEEIKITADPIRLDQALKLSGAVSTGGQAKFLIQSGKVTVNGAVETRRGCHIYDGDVISLDGETPFRIVKAEGV